MSELLSPWIPSVALRRDGWRGGEGGSREHNATSLSIIDSLLFLSSLWASFFLTQRACRAATKGGGPGKFCKLQGTAWYRSLPLPVTMG